MTLQLKSIALAFAFALLLPFASQAHEPDHSYIFLKIFKSGIEGRLEVAPIDLNHDMGLKLAIDVDSAEVAALAPELEAYMKSQLEFSSGD